MIYLVSQTIHKELEQKIAQFHNRDDAILYAACFDANGGTVSYNVQFGLNMKRKMFFVTYILIIFLVRTKGIFEGLLTPEDAVFSDQLNHASIIDGLRLCKANKYRYKHKGGWVGLGVACFVTEHHCFF